MQLHYFQTTWPSTDSGVSLDIVDVGGLFVRVLIKLMITLAR